jgi:phosphoglycolate phosphatase
MFERAFASTGAEVSPEQFTAYRDECLVHYRANIARESRPYPRVPETLDQLAQSGSVLGLCSNKPQALTELLLGELDLARHFAAIYGGGRAKANKPDPRHLLELVDALKADPARTIMIGDSPVDVAAARNAKIPVVIMSYGYSPTAPHEMGADIVLDDFSELPDAVMRLMG